MAENLPPPDKSSWTPARRANRATMVLAIVGALTVLAGTAVILNKVGLIEFDLLRFLAESDEAPIRVRNGSLDLFVLSQSQAWEQSGASGNYRIPNTERYKDEFEVTVAVKAGATCAAHTATGSDVVITYNNDKSIRLQSQNRHTFVKPDSGVTFVWSKASAQQLRYDSQGFIKSIAVGGGANPATVCSFTAANQLDHIIILNVP